MRFALAGLLLLLATGAPCEETLRPLAIYGLGAAADLAITEYAISRGAVEANPNPAMQSQSGRVAMNVAFVAGVTAIDVKLQRDGHNGWARALRIASVLARGYAVYHNVKVAR